MGHGADQPARGSAGQPRVRIKRNDVPDRGNSLWHMPADRYERRACRAAKQLIQLMQLASLPFPPHPDVLGLVPDTPAVKQHEARPPAGGGAVPLIQACDT